MKQTKLETISVREASRKIGTCYITALKLAKDGTLPCIRFGRQFRVLREPFEKMLKTPIKPERLAG